MRRTSILLFIFLLSIFNIKAQDYYVYEYYEVKDEPTTARGYDFISPYFSNQTRRSFMEYTFLFYDISILDDYHQMNQTHMDIYDIKPENYTIPQPPYKQAPYYNQNNNSPYYVENTNKHNYFIETEYNKGRPIKGYRLEYINGEYSKYVVYSNAASNPTKEQNTYVYRKRTFNNENEYINYLSIMNINPLPIELLYFNARYDNDMIIIKWSTGSETNNDYFNIEASNDGYVWNDILLIKGQGNTSIQTNYEYDIPVYKLDYKRGEPIYVRLKQTDYNGDYKTYEPQSILFNYDEPIYVYYNLEGRVYDNEYDIPPNTIYIKKELTTGESRKIIKII